VTADGPRPRARPEVPYEVLLAQEALLLNVSEEILRMLDRNGRSRTSLARDLGMSERALAEILAGRNITLRTLATIASALGARVDLVMVDLSRLPRPVPHG